MQGKQQGRCVVWIISWALQLHCNTRVPQGTNHLVSKVLIEIHDMVLQRLYVIWYRFVSLVKVLLDLLKLSNFLSLDPVFPKTKSICFWFQAVKNDLSLKKIFWKVCHRSKRLGWYYKSFVFSTSINFCLKMTLSLKISPLNN